MAEVRKKVVEDTYHTSKIKVKETAKKKPKKNDVKKSEISRQSNKNEKNLFVRFRMFCSGVKSEFSKVHWTPKNDMIKYSIACIFFIFICICAI